MGFSIYPDTKMSPPRMVAILQEYGPARVLVNSAADWGRSDPLLTLRTGEAMLAAGFTEDDVDLVLWRNPMEFYGQSGKLELSTVDGAEPTFEGNSILRGGS
jgi:predicted metal-dependent TIM-barrel fold hydrolase